MKKLLGPALLMAGSLAAAEARDVILYKAISAVAPSSERFVTSTLAEPAILGRRPEMYGPPGLQ